MRTIIYFFLFFALVSWVPAQEATSLKSGFIDLKFGVVELTDKTGKKRKVSRISESTEFTPVLIREGETVEVKGDDTQCSLVFPKVGTASLSKNSKV